MTDIDLNLETINSLAGAMAAGRLMARALTKHCLARIERVDPQVNAILELNPQALKIADQLDGECRLGSLRGPLHGLPILIKDNIDSADAMMTTAGSLALFGNHARADAFIVKRLRRAGAVLLGKTNLSEWANFRSTRSSSGWSSRGGQTRNPYALDRSPGRTGIIPISHSQDTAGPLARSVQDAAIVLNAIAGLDMDDVGTVGGGREISGISTEALAQGHLQGARIGIARNYCGFHEAVDKLVTDSLVFLREAGATLIDDLELTPADQIRNYEEIVMCTEFKVGLNRYLSQRTTGAAVHCLSDVIAFNERHRDTVMPYFGQERLIQSEHSGGLEDPTYLQALAHCRRLSSDQGIDRLIETHQLDAIIAPSTSIAWLIDWINGDNRSGGCAGPAAVAGYPNITVPAGYVFGLPVGLSFFSTLNTEAKLIRLAGAFEQAARARIPPRFAAHAKI